MPGNKEQIQCLNCCSRGYERGRAPWPVLCTCTRCVPGAPSEVENEKLARDTVLNERHFGHSPEMKQATWVQGGCRVVIRKIGTGLCPCIKRNSYLFEEVNHIINKSGQHPGQLVARAIIQSILISTLFLLSY